MPDVIKRSEKNPVMFVWLFYLICFIFRVIEYFVIRTDQGIIGEAFIHKLIGIVLLALAVSYLGCKWQDIGFCAEGALKGIGIGILFAGAMFFIAYGVEIIIHSMSGNAPSLRFFPTSYTVEGNSVMQSGAVYVLIVILGNIINLDFHVSG